jgi:hypothetical protein
MEKGFEIVTEKELKLLKRKADDWDRLYAAVDKCYEEDEETGEPIGDTDLGDIGEIAATHLGFL